MGPLFPANLWYIYKSLWGPFFLPTFDKSTNPYGAPFSYQTFDKSANPYVAPFSCQPLTNTGGYLYLEHDTDSWLIAWRKL